MKDDSVSPLWYILELSLHHLYCYTINTSTNICHHFFFIHFKYFHLMTYFSGVNIDFVAFSYHWINFSFSPSSHSQHRYSVKHFWLKMYLELQKSIENQFSNLSRELFSITAFKRSTSNLKVLQTTTENNLLFFLSTKKKNCDC